MGQCTSALDGAADAGEQYRWNAPANPQNGYGQYRQPTQPQYGVPQMQVKFGSPLGGMAAANRVGMVDPNGSPKRMPRPAEAGGIPAGTLAAAAMSRVPAAAALKDPRAKAAVQGDADAEGIADAISARNADAGRPVRVAAGGNYDAKANGKGGAYGNGAAFPIGGFAGNAGAGQHGSKQPGGVGGGPHQGVTPSPAPPNLPRASPSPPPPAAPSAERVVEREIRNWTKMELLGQGAFGSVYLALDNDTGKLMAVKQVAVRRNAGGNQAELVANHVAALEAEVTLLRRLDHPNIVRYLGIERTNDALHIFLEYVSGGSVASLLRRLDSIRCFPESVVRVYTRQILQGLAYLHANGIMHRDIKGANILVDNQGLVKLADFGASKSIEGLLTLDSGGANSVRGTPYWMAPEVITQGGYGVQADIWSVACTVIEMATGKPPWSNRREPISIMYHVANSQGPPALPENMSKEGKDFLLKCFNRNWRERPTAAELLKHPWLADVSDPPVVKAFIADQAAAGAGAAGPQIGAAQRASVSAYAPPVPADLHTLREEEDDAEEDGAPGSGRSRAEEGSAPGSARSRAEEDTLDGEVAVSVRRHGTGSPRRAAPPPPARRATDVPVGRATRQGSESPTRPPRYRQRSSSGTEAPFAESSAGSAGRVPDPRAQRSHSRSASESSDLSSPRAGGRPGREASLGNAPAARYGRDAGGTSARLGRDGLEGGRGPPAGVHHTRARSGGAVGARPLREASSASARVSARRDSGSSVASRDREAAERAGFREEPSSRSRRSSGGDEDSNLAPGPSPSPPPDQPASRNASTRRRQHSLATVRSSMPLLPGQLWRAGGPPGHSRDDWRGNAAASRRELDLAVGPGADDVSSSDEDDDDDEDDVSGHGASWVAHAVTPHGHAPPRGAGRRGAGRGIAATASDSWDSSRDDSAGLDADSRRSLEAVTLSDLHHDPDEDAERVREHLVWTNEDGGIDSLPWDVPGTTGST